MSEAAEAEPGSAPPPAGRRWGRIALAAAIVLVVVAALVPILLIPSHGSHKPTHADFVSGVNRLVGPVVSGDAQVGAELSAAQAPGDLAGVQAAAGRLVAAITSAQRGAGQLRVAAPDRPVVGRFQRALTQNLAYAEQVRSTAARPSAAGAAAAATAARAARSSWASLAEPGLLLPSADAISGSAKLHSLALQAVAAREHAAQAKPVTDAQWVRTTDALLQSSTGTRGKLQTLVEAVETGRIHAAVATAKVAAIVDRQRAFQSRTASQAPPHFSAAAGLLRQVAASALADGLATQRFVRAWYANDATSYNSDSAQHAEAAARAAAEEAAFLVRYNALRARFLHLKPIDVRY